MDFENILVMATGNAWPGQRQEHQNQRMQKLRAPGTRLQQLRLRLRHQGQRQQNTFDVLSAMYLIFVENLTHFFRSTAGGGKWQRLPARLRKIRGKSLAIPKKI